MFYIFMLYINSIFMSFDVSKLTMITSSVSIVKTFDHVMLSVLIRQKKKKSV